MADKFKLIVKKDAQAVKESTGSQFISGSGVYPITINFVSIEQKESGAASYNINYKYMDNGGTIYGPTIMNKNGEENEIGYRTLNKLMVIAGLDGEPNVDSETHTITTANGDESREFQVITDLSGVECQMQVKDIFNKYKGELKTKLSARLNIENFFTEDGATADELIAIENGNEVTKGSQLEKILAKESTTKYKLGKDENKVAVTEEEVEAFLSGGAKPAGTASAQAAPAVKKNLFGTKK